MAFDPCPSCKAPWYESHRADCENAAARFRADPSYANNFPRCPDCGHGTEDWHDFFPSRGGNGDGEPMNVICAHCEKEYTVEIRVSYSFRYEKEDD